jgi:uncharacterized membrane protein required for colicin V production
MFDRIGTPEIIDIATVVVVAVIGAFGFWRGIVKEFLITAGILIGAFVAFTWETRWANWLAENTTFDADSALFAVRAGLIFLGALLFGYIGSYLADLPPADMPGRVGGFIVGCVNGVLLIALLGLPLYALISADLRADVDQTRVLDWMLANGDWLVLGSAGAGVFVLLCSLITRRRRAAYLPVTATRPGSSGYQPRRGDQPLAPEAEKIDPVPDPSSYGTWNIGSPTSATVPLQRVADPTQGTDRPAPGSAVQPGYPPPPSGEEIVRCISCGERISPDDRFCPRCGRLLVH